MTLTAFKRLGGTAMTVLVLGVGLVTLGACGDLNKGGGEYQAPGGADVMNRQGPGDVATPTEGTAPKDQSTQGALGTGTGTGIPAPTTP